MFTVNHRILVRLFAVLLFGVVRVTPMHAQVNSVTAIGDDSLHWSNHIRTIDRGFLISNVNGFDSTICFVKLDSALTEQWTVATPIGTNNPGTGSGAIRMQELKDGSVVAMMRGTTMVMKISAGGSLIWKRDYTDINSSVSWYNNYLLDIVVTDSNTIVVCGTAFYNTPTGGTGHGWLQAMDTAGTILWSKDYLTGSDVGFSVLAATHGGGFTVFGEDELQRYCLIHFSDSGACYWVKRYDCSQVTGIRFEKMKVAEDSAYVIIGTLHDSIYRGVLLKFDVSGNYQWMRMYGDTNTTLFFDVIEVDEGYVICGSVSVSPGCGINGLVMCCDKSNGQMLWESVTGESSNPILYPVTFASIERETNGYIVCGHTSLLSGNPADDSNAALFSTDLIGVVPCYTMNHPLQEFPVAPLAPVNPYLLTYQHSIFDFPRPLTTQILNCSTMTGCPVGVAEVNENSNIEVFPNPAVDVLTFRFEESVSTRTIVIHDLSGREIVRKESSEQVIEFPVAGFSAGLYLYTIFENQEVVFSGKVVVQP